MSRTLNKSSWRKTLRALMAGRVFLIVLLLSFTTPVCVRSQVAEYDVKAAFLFNIAKYVEWSAEALPAGQPITIGVIGSDPFGKALDQLAGRKVNGRVIRVGRLKGAGEIERGQVVFISAAASSDVQQICAVAKSVNAVTVGDTEKSRPYTAINLDVDVSGRIVFTANLANVRSPDVRISSKLLSFAKSVRRAGSTSDVVTR